MKYNFVGVRAGGGKSHALITITANRYNEFEKTLIAAPTRKLIDQLAKSFQDRFPSVKLNVFYGTEDDSKSVVARVVQHLSQSNFGSEVVLITHACLFSLPYFPIKGRWQIIMDEAPSIYNSFTINLPDSHDTLTDHLAIEASSSVYGVLKVANKTAIKSIADNKKGDEFFATLQGTAKNLLNNNNVNWVKTTEFDKLIKNEKDRTSLIVHTIVKPSIFEGFEKVTIVAAGFESTLLYHVWNELGVKWSVDKELEGKLLRPNHPTNDTVTIYYGYDQPNSKTLRDKLIAQNDDHLRLKVIEVMGDDPFLWSENQDYKDRTILKNCNNGKMLPGVSHGLNDYQHIHHAVVLGAYNHRKENSAFLSKVYGFDRDRQRESMNLQIYQAVMRTSIRNDNIKDPKKIVVASRFDAESLQQRLPGSAIVSLDIPQSAQLRPGPKRKHATDNDRKRASDSKKANDTVLRTRFADNLSHDFISKSLIWDNSDESSYTSIDQLVRNFRGSYFNNWKDTEPQVICMKEIEWKRQLRDMHSNSFQAKDEINMISGAMFNADRNDGSTRHTDNVEFVRDVWLDFEDGDLTWDQLTSIFPTVEMTAYNSYRHTRRKPRFRMRILTDRPMLKHEYQSIYHEIMYVIHSNGYQKRSRETDSNGSDKAAKYSGLDYRPNPSYLSGLPCQAQKPQHSFYKDYDNNRVPLNVKLWLKQSSYIDGSTEHLTFPSPTKENDDLSTDQQEAVQAALSEWSVQTSQRGNGNRALFDLWLALRRAALPYLVLEDELLSAARKSLSSSDRIAQARRLLRRSKVFD
ncbi:DEAD/DEAH box helicase family protein [Methylobacterium sp. BTF04]|uniref:DEAD/DEAH box helicase family protein n=1 Tax=Methylobacterium sp. BTF04 TaxID=2708300 RepID=UPI0013D7F5E2|nr:DEAD/DEAH box helicase family protein [Methylobacterium sp. BTF04]NEU11557.1 DEAD/DEAH box helicase family protein [Methylobacterium sp. BTF04]